MVRLSMAEIEFYIREEINREARFDRHSRENGHFEQDIRVAEIINERRSK